MSSTDYWFCLEHHRVEPHDGCRNADRLGPYPSEAEASRALEKAAERNREWDGDDDWGVQPGSGAFDHEGED